ncbi:hypothetical protein Q5P01_001184 [Channa striata]|uniref:Uncharacterized protein n=1 Tax=Channa striata TaxID=64152 RepID=A0AA88NK82_CHASR|nr:hypothetical protein Q5P01_001184 [Channa striata]
MTLLHEKSSECVLSELDLFSCPLTQMSMEDKQYVEISPISSITDRGPIEFYIAAEGEKYLDLYHTLLYLRLKITNADGTDLATDEPVGIINYLLNTILNQCGVTLGDRLISQFSATHPYRAMIETLLNYSPETLKSQFTPGLFYQDTAGAMDSHVVVNGPNRGLTERARFSAKGFQVLGPLHADILFYERHLLNSVDIRVKLTRTVTVAPAVRIGHSAALIKSNENLFLGTLPNYIALALVNHEAFTGHSNLNPFNFIHCDLQYLAMCQDGRQIPALCRVLHLGVHVCVGGILKDLYLRLSLTDCSRNTRQTRCVKMYVMPSLCSENKKMPRSCTQCLCA